MEWRGGGHTGRREKPRMVEVMQLGGWEPLRRTSQSHNLGCPCFCDVNLTSLPHLANLQLH